MMSPRIVSLALFLIGLAGSEIRQDLALPPLDFERRVAAERIILDAYLRHQDGLRNPDSALSDDLLHDRVRSYLQKSLALERFWDTPVTREMLLAEWERIVRNTRFPDRLLELVQALDGDPLLVLECFARPVLVDRLTRGFFDFDRRIHADERLTAERLRRDIWTRAVNPADEHPGRIVADISTEGNEADVIDGLTGPADEPADSSPVPRSEASDPVAGDLGHVREERQAFLVQVPLTTEATGPRLAVYRIDKRSWDSWWEEARKTLDGTDPEPVAEGDERLLLPKVVGVTDPCAADDRWDNGSLNAPAEGGRWHPSVWTGTHMLVWGLSNQGRHALKYDPLTDTWSRTSEVNAPEWRNRAAAVWTGTEMILWGGQVSSTVFNTGGRYDPLADTWVPTSTVDAPSARTFHRVVWTGNKMIVWGGLSGSSHLNTGGQYDPATDIWSPTSTLDAPFGRSEHVAVWTGSEMIVWGSGSGTPTGGRYDPAFDQWSATSTAGAPLTSGKEAAVWTGTHMIVWGRRTSDGQGAGGRYDPATDAWTPVSSVNAPNAPYGVMRATGVWTGSEMIAWGGHFAGLPSGTNTGGRYDPVADVWAPTSLVNAPDARYDHTAVWTGSHMIVWGGVSFDGDTTPLGTGGRYDPMSDTWTPTSATNNGPTHRFSHTAIWTGTHMVVWGGQHHVPLNTGGLYDPMAASWMSTPTIGAPAARRLHRAVWTGSEMIVWGGIGGEFSGADLLNTGGLYDPVLNQWRSTSVVNAPTPRADHTAVWTGGAMLVWGGQAGGTPVTPLGDGAAYDPQTDLWQPISAAGAPAPRYYHSAVWTGARMIVWGGNVGGSATVEGGLYNPLLKTWTAMTTTGAPSDRWRHSAVWTGDTMLVWGGRSSCCGMNTGGRYDPARNTWTQMTTTGAPSARELHTAIWTGDLMVVWGGTFTQTGGRYSPLNDSWEPTSIQDAPSTRWSHSAVWSGESMIVWGGNVSGQNYGTGGRYAIVPGPDADQDGFHDCVADCDDSDASTYPGGLQLCLDGMNNDCSHPSWPALSDTNEADDDGDTLSECAGDCDDGDSGVWSLPGPVGGLAFTDSSTLTWNPPAQPGGMVVGYDTLRAPDPSGFGTSMTCVESDAPDTTSTDMSSPAWGEIVYYISRAQNGCGLGSAGTASDGTPRAAADCQPPPTPQGVRLDR